MTAPVSIGDGATMRPLTASDAAAVQALIERNRAHLDKWLRWSARVQSLADVQAMIVRFEAKTAAGDGFHWGIWQHDMLVGGVICHYINRGDLNAELGYWLGADFTGKGLATRASAAAVRHLLREEKLHRLEMVCGVANTRSRAVAERLGFQNEGVRREAYWITDRFVDHVLYGLLAREWRREESGIDETSR
jgi:ribosomal-protein-serine acetyltransferase